MSHPDVIATEWRSADHVVLRLALPPEHPAFDGHFPGQPVLPGVVQTDWAVRLADELLQSGCAAATDFQVKFRRVVEPGNPLELTLRIDRIKGSLSFEYSRNGDICSSGRIKLEGTAS